MAIRNQQELRRLGFFGIYKESYKLIRSYWRFFSKIFLTLILPLNFIFSLQIVISYILIKNISSHETDLELARTNADYSSYTQLSDKITMETSGLLLFLAVSLTFYLILTILSTSTVAYTITCIFTAREFTLRNVIINIAPRVWKRLLTTFICVFVISNAYNIIASSIIVLINYFCGNFIWLILLLAFLFCIWTFYLVIVFNLACVVSVMEDCYGLEAIAKSGRLIRGKFLVAMAINFMFLIFFGSVFFGFLFLVVFGFQRHFVLGAFGTILWWIVVSKWNLFWWVIQTMIYLVCKSKHRENIDEVELLHPMEVEGGENREIAPVFKVVEGVRIEGNRV